jgi:ketosteroid isomerase-like protein
MRRWIATVLLLGVSAGCASTANVAQERENLMKVDREWAANAADANKFLSYYAADATVYVPGMPLVTGTAKIRETWNSMTSTPGFAITFGPTKADVSSSGDVGYTVGTYKMTMGGTTETGKYVCVWKKQADSTAPPAAHVMVASADLVWGDPPPSLPAGAKLAVVSGDPSKPGPFVIRAQVPAGYRIAPHWHPGDEHVTVLSGSIAMAMGDKWDDAALKTLPAGGFFALPAKAPHYLLSKSASTVQVHGVGPLQLNYVNPDDDPSKAKK